ncbi:MAG: O-antigen ligase family protein, partial [Firmicutes bacterium]|nr:O-antigen ligase family protein [Bacillota bacterium]
MACKKEKISFDCLMACVYFICLPLTVITTPFGSMLKIVTIPVVAILSVRLIMGKSNICFNYIHFTYFIYVLYTVFQLIFYNEEVAMITTRDMVLGFLAFMLISARIYNEQEVELIEWIWVLVGVICIFAALMSKEVVSEYEERAVIKIFGFEEDQNQFCSYFIMPILICIKRLAQRRRFMLFYIAMILLIIYSILRTGSRGGLIGILLGVFLYILIGIKSTRKKIFICISTVLLSLIVVTALFPMLPETVRERYSVDSVEEDRGSGRFEIWEYLMEYTFDKPERIIRGSGVLSSYEILDNAPKTFHNGVAHNTFIQVFSDQGLIGLFLFICVMIACLLRPMGTERLYT